MGSEVMSHRQSCLWFSNLYISYIFFFQHEHEHGMLMVVVSLRGHGFGQKTDRSAGELSPFYFFFSSFFKHSIGSRLALAAHEMPQRFASSIATCWKR